MSRSRIPIKSRGDKPPASTSTFEMEDTMKFFRGKNPDKRTVAEWKKALKINLKRNADKKANARLTKGSLPKSRTSETVQKTTGKR